MLNNTEYRMTNAEHRAGLMMEALSERLLKHADVAVWRGIFLGSGKDAVQFESERCTVLVSDSPLPGISRHEGALLARRLGAEEQPSTDADLVLAFPTARAALRGALVIQRLAEGRNVRTALTTVLAPAASVEIEDWTRRVLVGPEIERAEAALGEAVAGTILVCGDTYRRLGDSIAEHVRDGLVITEMDDETTVTQASITLPPHASSEASTFAGLGRF
jgi:hypothetical protein